MSFKITLEVSRTLTYRIRTGLGILLLLLSLYRIMRAFLSQLHGVYFCECLFFQYGVRVADYIKIFEWCRCNI